MFTFNFRYQDSGRVTGKPEVTCDSVQTGRGEFMRWVLVLAFSRPLRNAMCFVLYAVPSDAANRMARSRTRLVSSAAGRT